MSRIGAIWPMTKPLPQVAPRDGFDPETVTQYQRDGGNWMVLASDYEALLALYRELKAKEAFHGF